MLPTALRIFSRTGEQKEMRGEERCLSLPSLQEVCPERLTPLLSGTVYPSVSSGPLPIPSSRS